MTGTVLTQPHKEVFLYTSMNHSYAQIVNMKHSMREQHRLPVQKIISSCLHCYYGVFYYITKLETVDIKL